MFEDGNFLNNNKPRVTEAYCYEYDGYFIIRKWSKNYDWDYHLHERFIKEKSGDIKDWIISEYNATNILATDNAAGHSVKGVWRPGIIGSTKEARISAGEDRDSLLDKAKSMLILVNNLHEILCYVEPKKKSKLAYGHKIRDLLILSCTELENIFKSYLITANYNDKNLGTKDYYKLKAPYHLDEFEISLLNSDMGPIRPFLDWNDTQPTQSLTWYDAYNKIKHNRAKYFDKSTLENTIIAVSAVIILFCARYGMDYVADSNTAFSGLFNSMFRIELTHPDKKSFYLPVHPFEIGHTEGIYTDLESHYEADWIAKEMILS